MAPHNTGPCPSSSTSKLFPDLATILNPFLHLASLQPRTTPPTKPQMNEAEEPSAKRRKTVDFAPQVEMRHVDENDGSVLDVETRDLHPDSDEEDPAYLGLANAARNVDKSLFFLSKTDFDERAMPVDEYPADKSWSYGKLDDLLRHYTDGDMAEGVSAAAHKFKCRTSSVLLALSRILKRVEDVKEAKSRELEDGEDQEDDQENADESSEEIPDHVEQHESNDGGVGEMLDHVEEQEDEEEDAVKDGGKDEGKNGNRGENTTDKEDDEEDNGHEEIEYMAPRARRIHGRVTGRRISRGGLGRGSTGGENVSGEDTSTGSTGRGGVSRGARTYIRTRSSYQPRWF
ncbi:hypothetical protein B0I37DRAFT_421466 [Chaetomium sp. MPI-CAGE-AT-0009]|nr:hypothetical protein B0I37DRAFT_421466 [Chaetomium sp. MPI-CAGE-AT-0009]